MTISTKSPRLCRAQTGDVQLAYTDEGSGDPIVCIHGSWDNHQSWDDVAEVLRKDYRVVTYDRRGHSASTDVPGQGRLSEDVQDARDLIEALNLGPAHIIGHSYGATVAITLASMFPDTTLSLFVHEPPVFSLLTGNSELEELRTESMSLMKQAAGFAEKGEIELAAKLFVEHVAFGEGSWENLFCSRARAIILSNVDSWVDQFKDPERLAVDVTTLCDYPNNITFSTGTNSFRTYREVTKKISELLPQANVATIKGGAHGAHISHPDLVSKAIRAHLCATK